jgi:hypothetical protein
MSGAGNFVDHAKSGNYIHQECHFHDANEDDVVKVDPVNLNGTCGGLVLKLAFAGTVNGFIVCPGGMHRFGLENAVTASTRVWARWMVQNINKLSFSPHIDDGTAVFRTVRVDD